MWYLDVIRVDLVLGQDIERAVVVSVLEYATTRVMPEKYQIDVIFNIEVLTTHTLTL